MGLVVLNKFQRTVVNRDGEVKWDLDNKTDMKRIEDVAALIKAQLEGKDENEEKESARKFHFITEFGAKLFREFCEHKNTNKIFIKSFESLPTPMKEALFGGNAAQISFVSIATMFKNAEEIELSELNLNKMASVAQIYVDAVIHFEQHSSASCVSRIAFKSKKQSKNKENSPLKHLARRKASSCRAKNWNLKYQFASEKCHELVFTRSLKGNNQ